MIRVADRIFAAETLPIARTKAQAAHLEMYNLREEIFEAILGSKDDIHYPEFNAYKHIVSYGEDHPPVGVISAIAK